MNQDYLLSRGIARTHEYWGRKPLDQLLLLFKNLKKDDLFIDPLCGAGNAVIAALFNDARVIASDLNPMAVFLTKTIIRPVTIHSLLNAFEHIQQKISKKMEEVYTIKCPNCGNIARIDHIVWEGKKEKAQPTNVKIACPHCGINKKIEKELSTYEKRIQKELSHITPTHWYPTTQIKSYSKIEVETHSELFTGRNLSLVALLFDSIQQIKQDNCKDTFLYIFTSILYSCSEMQMFSKNDTSSSPGLMTPRYYIPKIRKEKNVWKAFSTRFRAFIHIKNKLNQKIPFVNITDNVDTFYSDKRFNVCLMNTHIINFNGDLYKDANHIFLDPPFLEDISYMDFSEFWGTWLNFDFDFNSEINLNRRNKEIYKDQLEKILNTIHNNISDKTDVTIAFSNNASTQYLFDLIKKTGFSFDKNYRVEILYHNKSIKKAEREEMYLRLIKSRKKNDTKIRKNQESENNINEIFHYCKTLANFYSSTNDIIKMLDKIIPERLRSQFSKLNKELIEKAITDSTENTKAYHSLCLNLLNIIFKNDELEIMYINPAQFNIDFLNFKQSAQKQIVSKEINCAFIVKSNDIKLFFCFDDMNKGELKNIADTVCDIDNEKFNNIAVLICKDIAEMNNYRHSNKADEWKRGFFTSFEEIMDIDEERFNTIIQSSIFSKLNVHRENKFNVKTLKARVISHIPVGHEIGCNHYKLRISTSDILRIIPGQFIMIETTLKNKKCYNNIPRELSTIDDLKKSKNDLLSQKPNSYLKRPFGIHRAFYKYFSPDYLQKLKLPEMLSLILHIVYPNEFDIFYKVLKNGIGTNELKNVCVNTKLNMIGPLGKKFDIRKLRREGYEEVHVVGGGVGMAPLIFLVQALKFFSFNVIAFFGIEDISLLRHKDPNAASYVEDSEDVKIYYDDLRAAGLDDENIFISCDKNCSNSKMKNYSTGFISEQYRQYLKKANNNVKRIAFTCGPTPMMSAIYKITENYHIDLKVLMEKRMACGIGVCLSCVCEMKSPDNFKKYAKVCVDGPIFDAKDIVWD